MSLFTHRSCGAWAMCSMTFFILALMGFSDPGVGKYPCPLWGSQEQLYLERWDGMNLCIRE
jgi:uncharacterized protein involved in response to NO